MAVLVDDKVSRIKILLKAHPKGLTITDISSKLNMNRNSAAKYLEILRISGHVESKSYGTARVFFLTHRLPISALVSVTSDLVVTLDEHHRILFVNEGFCNLFAVKKDDAAGSHIVDIFKTGIGSDVLPGVFSDVIADQEKVHEVRVPGETGDLFFKIKSMKTVFDDGSRGITIIMEDVTREQRDKIELEAKEARYRGIVEDQTEFIIRFLPSGTLSFVNASFSHALKKKPGEILGTDFPALVHAKDRPVFDRCFRSLDCENPVTTFECRLSVPKSPVRWITWTLRAMFDGGRIPLEYQAVGFDCTEKKEALEKIHRSIAQMELFSKELQRFIELAPGDNIYEAIGAGLSGILPGTAIVVSSFDQETTTLTVRAVLSRTDHDIFSRYLGRDLAGFRFQVGDAAPPEGFLTGKLYPLKKNLHDLVFQQIPADICSDIENALDLGDFYSIGLIWKDALLGNIVLAFRKGQELSDRSLVETYVRAASICLKRSIAENALKESETLYRTVIENIQDVFYRSDTEGNLVLASPSFAAMLGYSSLDECLGRNLARDFCLLPEKRDALLTAIASQGSVSNYEMILKKNDGTPIFVSTNSHIYSGPDGAILGIEGTFHDISDRKAADERVYRYIGEMEFLSQKLMDFMMMEPSENIFEKIVSDLKNLIPGSLVAANSFDPKTGIVTIRAAAMSERQREIIIRLLGKDVVGTGYPIDENGLSYMRRGRLLNAHISLYEVFFKSVPETVCKKLESELGFGDIFGIGFVRGGEILGNAVIFLEQGKKIPDFPLVEMYAREAAIAIQRYAAEEARRRSDEIFYNIAQNSPLPIALIDPNGSYLFINGSFSRLFGYTLDDFHTGREWFRMAFPDPGYRKHAVEVWKLDREQHQTGCPFRRTFSVRCRDLSVKDIIFRPVTLSDGKQCIVYEDITDRNRADQTNRLLSSIIRSTSDAVIAKDSSGTIISWNRAAERLYGYPENEMVGHNISRIIPADKTEEMEKIFSRIQLGDSVSNLETRRVRKDGRVIDVSLTVSPITDDTGVVTGASIIARDITPHQAEERLRRNEEQYRSLVENISVGFYRSTGDPAGRFIWGNSSLVRILGYPSFELLRGIAIADMFIEPDGRKNLLEDLKKEGFVKNREIALRKADGETVHVLVTALARFGISGDIACINGIVQDISGQRLAEQRALALDKEMLDIVAFIPDPVIITDSGNTVLVWNTAAEQLTGVRKTGVIGRTDYEHLLPFYDPARPALVSFFDASDDDLGHHYPGAYRDGPAIIAPVRDLARRDDPLGFFTIRTAPLCNPRGERTGAIQIIRAAKPDGRNSTLSSPFDPVTSGMR